MDHFHPRTGGSQCVDRRVEGDQAHGLRRWAQREDKHAFEAGRQIRVVRGVEAAIKVMVAVKQDGWRAEGSGGGGNRIDQIDPALAVEGAPRPGLRIDGAARRRAGSTRSAGMVAVFMEPPGCDAMALQSDPVQRQGKSPEQIEEDSGAQRMPGSRHWQQARCVELCLQRLAPNNGRSVRRVRPRRSAAFGHTWEASLTPLCLIDSIDDHEPAQGNHA